jgi:hypothetical protein
MDWDEYILKYFGMDEETLSQTAWRLEEALLHEGILVNEEARIYIRYTLLNELKKLRSWSEPTPKVYEEVLRLYDIDVPVFIVPPERVEEIRRGQEAFIFLFSDKSYDPHRPLAILIDRSYPQDCENVNEARLMLLLHMVAWIVFEEELRVLGGVLRWLISSVKQSSERFLYEDMEEGRVDKDIDYIVNIVIGMLIHGWAVEQFSKLRVYLNDDSTDWRSPLTFEDVSREFDRGIGFGVELFRPPPSIYNGEWPLPRRERRARRAAVVLDEGDPARLAPAYEYVGVVHRKCLERKYLERSGGSDERLRNDEG